MKAPRRRRSFVRRTAAAAVAAAAAWCLGAAVAEDSPLPAAPPAPPPTAMRPHLVVGRPYVFTSSVDLDANLSASSARGSGSGRASVRSVIELRLTVESEDAAQRPLTARVLVKRFHVSKSDFVRTQEDAERARIQKGRRLDPDDHPLAGHTLTFGRAGKAPSLQDWGTEAVKAAGTRVEKKYGDVVGLLDEILSPSWAERAPAAAAANDAWKFDPVRLLRFGGIELPERIHKPEDGARGEGEVACRFADGKRAELGYTGEIHGRWETNPWTSRLSGTISFEPGDPAARTPLRVSLELPKSAFGIDESKTSGVRGEGTLSASMKLTEAPVDAPRTPAAPVPSTGDSGGASGPAPPK